MMPKKQSKRWSLEETKAFLKFYSERKHEFQKARKRRLAFSHVLQDMISAGFDSNINVAHLEVKMQTLLRAYKATKYNGDISSPCPSIAPFAKELKDIFGDLNGETLNIGTDNFVYTVSEVPDTSRTILPCTPGTSRIPVTHGDEFTIKTENLPGTEITIKSEPIDEFASRASSPSSSSSESGTPIKIHKKKMTRSEYYERRLEQKEREQEAIAERWKQHQQAKEEWRRIKLEMLQRILEK